MCLKCALRLSVVTRVFPGGQVKYLEDWNDEDNGQKIEKWEKLQENEEMFLSCPNERLAMALPMRLDNPLELPVH